MYQPSKKILLAERFSKLDIDVFSALCSTYNNISWTFDANPCNCAKDDDDFCGIDLQVTATTKSKMQTYDIELKCVMLDKFLPYCYMECGKWLKLVSWNNDRKLYVAIYPKHNKVLIWAVDSDLLKASEKDTKQAKKSTVNGQQTTLKCFYKLPTCKAKVFNIDLSEYLEKYNAIYQQINTNQVTKERQAERTHSLL